MIIYLGCLASTTYLRHPSLTVLHVQDASASQHAGGVNAL